MTNSNAPKIEAFKSYYQQAKEAYATNDMESSRELFIKAASLANEISIQSSSYDVKMEFHALTDKILKFLKNDFGKNMLSNAPSEHQGEDKTFLAEKITEQNKITFKDVAGLTDVKEEILYNVIEPLKNPELAKSYNIKPGAKILLYGPPGTGKTFIARAIAGEINAEFYSINCQDLISKYMGESSKQIDLLFEEAEKNKKAIIFFDEFDSLASKRENDNGSATDAEMSRFVATFLTKVDGFRKPKDCEMLLLIAATNRPWAIDSAMLRGGRFDTQIYVGLPDLDARIFLIQKEFKNIQLKDFDSNYLADKLNEYNGADIVSTCRKIKQLAYRRAIKSGEFEAIDMNDVEEALHELRPSLSDYDAKRFEDFKKGII